MTDQLASSADLIPVQRHNAIVPVNYVSQADNVTFPVCTQAWRVWSVCDIAAAAFTATQAYISGPPTKWTRVIIISRPSPY